ncbi:MAG: 30S ribosomal protein S7, partial [Actinomycetota bacterium]|nr:30S ribosomal protein S7 [Actinomycetota bacterium]
MPRKGPAPRREIVPDPVYHSTLVTQLINKILSRGKKTLAESIVYGALDNIKERTGGDPLTILKKA